ncbi:MAG: HEPN domain-containing protein [Candidatus Taylorbacteria bacterium]|nr:HEPN domain-containing protein [Candidatus Taylorbacteria bacterium]
MSNKDNLNYKEWFKKAEEDEEAGTKLLENNGPFGSACFHFQQMAEKLLKGFLVYYDKEPPRTHDLVELETIIKDIEPNIENYKKEIDLLNSYYIETRYPGDFPEIVADEAKQAFDASKRLKEFAEKLKELSNE